MSVILALPTGVHSTLEQFAAAMAGHTSVTTVTVARTVALFLLTAIAEIVGCYLPYLWLRQRGGVWLLAPAACSLAIFVWLLTLHPASSGRVYAAYGAVYVVTALAWLRVVDGVALQSTDIIGGAIVLLGMSIIIFGTPTP